MKNDRLEKQIRFIIEIDKLKQVFRQSCLMDGSRMENDAEHSWHLAVMAILLSEYSEEKGIDVLKVVKMVLVHDIVEIDAGDTYRYDDKGHEDKAEREQKAADRIFGILPDDEAAELRSLWDEFELRETPEARFASVLDRLQPILHNYMNKGEQWRNHGITASRVISRNSYLRDSSEALWEYIEDLIKDATAKGYIDP